MSRSPGSRSRPTRLLHSAAAGALGLALALATGCATAQKPDAALKPIVWPFPPDKPRVRFVRALHSGDDLGAKSAWKQLISGFAPPERTDWVYLPTGLALSPDEKRLVVSCGAGRRVLEFDFAKGTSRLVANEEGYTPGNPFGVAIDEAGALYVSDSIGPTVWVFGPDGAFQRKIGSKLLVRPTGIALDRKRQLLYVVDVSLSDKEHHVVEVFSLAGEHLRTIGRRGAGPGEFNFPSYVAVGPDGNVYVADTLNFRIQVFDPNGDLVTMFGAQGNTIGMFGKIKGIGFDALGNVHVVDSEPAVVTIWDPKQQLMMLYGGRADRIEFMMSPTAIVIDSKNNIYVADYQRSEVKQYLLFDTSPPDEAAAPPAAAPPAPKPGGAAPTPPPAADAG